MASKNDPSFTHVRLKSSIIILFSPTNPVYIQHHFLQPPGQCQKLVQKELFPFLTTLRLLLSTLSLEDVLACITIHRKAAGPRMRKTSQRKPPVDLERESRISNHAENESEWALQKEGRRWKNTAMNISSCRGLSYGMRLHLNHWCGLSTTTACIETCWRLPRFFILQRKTQIKVHH